MDNYHAYERSASGEVEKGPEPARDVRTTCEVLPTKPVLQNRTSVGRKKVKKKKGGQNMEQI